MKIIDALNNIANGKDMPKKFMFNDTLYEYNNACKDYYAPNGENLFGTLFRERVTDDFINNEVELIEEPKKIEKINRNRYNGTDIDPLDDILDKLDELIDEINNLKGE